MELDELTAGKAASGGAGGKTARLMPAIEY